MPSPLNLSSESRRKLRKNTKLRKAVTEIDWNDVRHRDIPDITKLLGLVKKCNEPTLREALTASIKTTVPNALNALNHRRWRAAAAFLLGGAAIARSNLALRDDLDSSIVEARNTYIALADDIPDVGGDSTVMLSWTSAGALTPFQSDMVEAYICLTRNAKDNGKVLKSFEELLTNSDLSLQLGSTDLNRLNIDAIESECTEQFRAKETISKTGLGVELPASRIQYREGTDSAPKKLTIKANNFNCHKVNEGPDQIFWLSWLYSIENLSEVYTQIDSMVAAGLPEEITLEIDWNVSEWQSKLFEGIVESTETNLPEYSKELEIHKGFCPWHLSLMCIEDDDQEYAAVAEVFSDIQETADVISRGARIVASVSGPTAASAASAAVSVAAGLVSVIGAIGEAIVNIINLFDDNDTIGFASFSGLDDYADRAANKSRDLDDRVGNSSIGIYSISGTETTGAEMESFHRPWAIDIYTAEKQFSEGAILFFGDSGEETIKLTFPEKVDYLAKCDMEYDFEAGVRNAHWIVQPKLQTDDRTVKGKFHWGVSLAHRIDINFVAKGWKFGIRL